MAEILQPGQAPPGYQQAPMVLPQGQLPPGFQLPGMIWDQERRQMIPSQGGQPPSGYSNGEPYWIDPDPGAAGYAMERQESSIPPRTFAETLNDIGGYADIAATGATIGAWPHINAALTGGIPGIFSEAGFGGGYQQRLEQINENMNRVRSLSPNIAAVTEMGGAMIPALATGGATMSAQTGGNLLANALRSVGAGATLGLGGAATYGFLEGTGDVNERAERALDYAPWGAGIGALVPAGFAVAPAALRAARALVPRSREARISGAPGARYSEQNIVDAANTWRAQTRDLYDQLEASGVRLQTADLDYTLRTAQINLEPRLRNAPAANSAIDDLIARTAEYPRDIPVGTVETWRQDLNQEISDLWRTNNGRAATLLEEVRDQVDDQILGQLGTEAREAYLNTIRIDALQEAATRAADRAGRQNIPYEDALQAQLQRIKDGRLWARFSPEQQEAITAAIRDPGPLAGVENMFNFIFGRGIRRIASNTVGAIGAVATQNPLLALPAVTDALARASRSITQQGNLNRVADYIIPGGGAARQPGIPTEVLRQVNALSRAAIPAVATRYSTGGGF